MTEHPSAVAVVMLTRSIPVVPQVASPATMPGWFPRIGATTVPVYLRDLTWTGSAPIDCSESAVSEISAGLFALDGAILDRLAGVQASTPASTDSFWGHARFDDSLTLSDFLIQARAFREKLRNRTAFRPDANHGTTVVARIWKIVQRTSPERLRRVGTSAAAALQIPDGLDRDWHQPFSSVLGRPATPPPSPGVAFTSSIMRTVASSAQFITVAAHAGEYEKFPVALLRSTSLDLLDGMRDATTLLRSLEHPDRMAASDT
jgi:hypothetical protein